MAKEPRNELPTKPSQSESQARAILPKGHFNEEGTSQGIRTGNGRSTHDAWNTDVKDGDRMK